MTLARVTSQPPELRKVRFKVLCIRKQTFEEEADREYAKEKRGEATKTLPHRNKESTVTNSCVH